ncbi:MAG: hypothetical protein M0R17_09405 [Candidatus Omnitrophica bacterium]|nr:hypothetical protein [Candidatus Omnitrophota bacterium]
MKSESIEVIKGIKNLETIKIKRKPTKKKIIEFHIMGFQDNPFIQVFINEKFYETLFIKDGNWVEERKDFEN